MAKPYGSPAFLLLCTGQNRHSPSVGPWSEGRFIQSLTSWSSFAWQTIVCRSALTVPARARHATCVVLWWLP